jgi:hypothetical protein
MTKQGKIVERELPAETQFGRALLALKLPYSGFFNVDKDGKPFGELMTIEQLTEQNNKSLPYNLGDLDHQARLFLKNGMSPREAFIMVCGEEPAFRLMRALAASIATAAKAMEKEKAAR